MLFITQTSKTQNHKNIKLMDNTSTIICCGTVTGKQHLAILDYTSAAVNLSIKPESLSPVNSHWLKQPWYV